MFAVRRPRPLRAKLLTLAVATMLTYGLTTTAAHAANTYTVNDLGDQPDITHGNGICETGAGNGICTLRAAIEESDADGIDSTIKFAVPSLFTIAPNSALPAITAPVAIEGSSQPGYVSTPIVVLDGRNITTGNVVALALNVSSGASSVIEGLSIINSNTPVPPPANQGFATGIENDGSVGATIESNYIGTNGTADLGNNEFGIVVSHSDNTIQNNVISGNGEFQGCCGSGYGIYIAAGSNNLVRANLIGTNAAGNAAIGNRIFGIGIQGSVTGTMIGGSTSSDRNVISGNGHTGISINGSPTNTTIENNYIGTNASGTAAMGNAINGILINGVTGTTTIGAPGAGNIISGNSEGVEFANFINQSASATIQGNSIGTNATGTTAIGNANSGIDDQGAGLVTIGGTANGAGNTISGNGAQGIFLRGGATNVSIDSNQIGSGPPLINAGPGIEIAGNGTSNNTIHQNVIENNAGPGVKIDDATTDNVGNRISHNVLLGNSGSAPDIDLGGHRATENDALDIDTGPNNLQNYPAIDSAAAASGMTTVDGHLDSKANHGYLIEVFASSGAGPCNGDVENFLGLDTISTDGSGHATFQVVSGSALAQGVKVTATATDQSTNDTSEFSDCTAVASGVAQADLQIGNASRNTAIAGDPNHGVDYKFTVSNNGPDPNDGYNVAVTLPGTTDLPNLTVTEVTNNVSCGSITGNASQQMLECTGSSLGVTDPQTGQPDAIFEITGTVPASEPDNTQLTASATITATGSVADPNPNNTTTGTTTVLARADLSIAKDRSTARMTALTCPDQPVPCVYANMDATQNAIVYSVKLTNSGPSDAQNVVVTDTLDANQVENATYCKVLPDTTCPSLGDYSGTINEGTFPPGTVEYWITAHAKPELRNGPFPNVNRASVSSSTLRTDDTANNPSAHPFLQTADVSTTIDTVPGSPAIQFTTTGQTSAGVEWTAPTGDGGQPIQTYHVVASPCPSGGPSCTVVTNNNVPNASIGGAPAFSYIISGLTAGTTYQFNVFATNDVGDSDPATVFLTPSVSAANNIIPATGSATVDTGLAGGAQPCATGVDPSSPNCKDIVGQYSLSAPSDAGSLFGLSTVPNAQSIQSAISFVAARNFALTSTSTPTGPCYEVDFTTASIVSPDDCNVVANKAVLSTYPTTKATLTTPHLEITQQDATVSTLTLGAPCLQLRTDLRANTITDPHRNGAVIVDPDGHWSCLNPKLSNGQPMPECPETVPSTGWTKTNPCAYLYYSVVDIPSVGNIPGYDLHPNDFAPPSVRATKCTTGDFCGQPIIIGGSVHQGIKFVEKCTDAVNLTGCTTRQITFTFSSTTYFSQVRPWCVGKFPNFQYLPCVFKAQWLNKSTGNGNNDIQWQEYMTGDPGKRTTG